MFMEVKFGFSIPVPTYKLDLAIEGAKKAEQCGFESLWYADHLTMIPPDGRIYDAFVFLTTMALNTSKLTLCTAVSDPHRRHPAVMAHILATLDMVSNGRAMFGIGAGEAMNLDMFGIDGRKPVSKMKEFIEVMRLLWKENRVNYDGEFFTLKDAFLQLRPAQRTIPIYIAANGPVSRTLTGEIADGWFPFYESPRLIARHAEDVKQGAKKAGRCMDEIDVCYNCMTAIADDFEAAYKRVEFMKGGHLLFPDKLKEEYNIDIPKDLVIQKITPSNQDLARLLSYINKVPNRILQDFNIIGTVDQVINQIEAFINAGVKHFALLNRGPDPNKVFEIYRDKIIPYFKGRQLR
jgi:alkanesulfonate monooxygenase SsuD/methylene tetrahydromethanopterin reductase-like flavin-dependent oxidoreductase (luciferase family)